MMQAKVLQSPRWLPVIVWAACILFTLTVWRVLRAQERKQTEHLVESSLADVSTRISAHIDGSLRSLTQMARHWQRQDTLKQVEWEADTQAHIAHEPGYVCIGWVNPSRDLRWISPGSKEKAFREHILRMDGAPAQVLWESLEIHVSIIFLVQRGVLSDDSENLDFDIPLNESAMFLRSRGLYSV